MKRLLFAGAALLATPLAIGAQGTPADTAIRVAFGGFVDTYFAYDIGRPPTLDRSFAGGATFTTQPARHNEFNINLAYVEAILSGGRVRGRLALQAGTSVQSNYAAEPAVGSISGPTLARHIQEAFAGYQLTPSLWVDAGVFYSHMGLESWASKDNLTYTRSLTAEYSPYYSSGVRAIWQASPRLTAHLHVVNGWQNISETNSGKGAGLRFDFAPAAATTVSYYNLFNEEAAGRLRMFNGVGARWTGGGTTLLGQFDVGSLEGVGDDDASSWYAYTLIARRQLTPTVGVAGRFEGFDDEDQVNIATGGPDPFRGTGASLGIDVAPAPRLLWRTEARGFVARDEIFPDRADASRKRGGFVVTSLAMTF